MNFDQIKKDHEARVASQLEKVYALLKKDPGNRFLSGLARQLERGRVLSVNQRNALDRF